MADFNKNALERLSHRRTLTWLAGSAALALTACGGGGGGGPISTPSPPPVSPAPTPPPAPTPAPPPAFDTAEVTRSDGPEQHDAISAWQDGTTGEGQLIAIVDTGIDLDSPEFAGRIDRRSTYIAGDGDAQEVDDHGTHVALVAAAALDQTGVVGIAHDADILALRADRPGTCQPGDDASLDGCRFADRDLAAAVTRATNAGAAVINLSLGGSNPGTALNDAVAQAAAAGVVIVVSAGNDGGTSGAGIDPDNPDRFAQGLLAVGGDNVLIVGSVDENGDFSDFSNKAGDSGASFLSARGERICCIYEDGVLRRTTRDGQTFVTVFSGTSFAAPQVSGAVALLAQAFPNLTGAQIVEILLETAADAGAQGIDRTFGRGILDIGAAIAPIGTTRLAGGLESLELADDAAIGSGAMGDALETTTLGTVVLDKYDRAYGFKLGSRLRGAAPSGRIYSAVSSHGRRVAAGSDRVAMAFTVGATTEGGGMTPIQPLRPTDASADLARVLAGRVSLRLSPDARIGMSFSERSEGLVAHLQRQDRPAFLIARDVAGDTGFDRTGKLSLAARHDLGGLGLTISAEQGSALLGARRKGADILARQHERFETQTLGLAVDRSFGPVSATLSGSMMNEERTILGAYWHEAIGPGGASTLFVDAGVTVDLSTDWQAGASWRRGLTRPDAGGAIESSAAIHSDAFAFDLARRHALVRGDRLAFRLSQPLRVSGGGIDLTLPTAYDYAARSPIYGTRHVSLSPSGRELVGELSWQGSLWGGALGTSLFLRREPGHRADAPDDAGMVVRWDRRF